jgi:hypothetical protein
MKKARSCIELSTLDSSLCGVDAAHNQRVIDARCDAQSTCKIRKNLNAWFPSRNALAGDDDAGQAVRW